MPITIKFTATNGAELSCTVNTGLEAFRAYAGLAEMFGEKSCGKCKSDRIRPLVMRTRAGDDMYKWHCDACGAELFMAEKPDGKGLFPSRTDREKNPKSHQGWEVYERNGQAQPAPADQPDPAPTGDDQDIPF